MVFKLGCSSELNIGCLYNICSVLRKAFKAKAVVYSREVAVLPSLAHSRALMEQNFMLTSSPRPLLLSPQNAIYFLDPNTISFTFYDFLSFFPVRPPVSTPLVC